MELNKIEQNKDLSSKVIALENQVKILKSENKSLVHRIIYLEELVKKICEKESIPANFNSLPSLQNTKKIKLNPSIGGITPSSINYGKKNLPAISQSQIINNQMSKTMKDFILDKEEKEETWLYYILSSQNLTTDKILSLLKIVDPDKTVLEISANDFVNEYGLYIKLLEKFESFNEYSQDFQSMETPQVISYFEEIFEVTLMSDTVIIIRNIPSKKNASYEELIVIIASLVEKVHKIFNNVLQKENDSEALGKMKMVLETQEDLNILNVVKNDSRFLLSIEKLNDS
jgi:hypothetical protein